MIEYLQQCLEWCKQALLNYKNNQPPPPLPPKPPITPPVTIKPPTPTPERAAPIPSTSRELLIKMSLAIADYEGGPGDLNHRNNNPGNLRKWGNKPIRNGFAVFDTWNEGMDALRQLITLAAMGKTQSYTPNMTLVQFFEKYAPSSDGNHPTTYAIFVAKRMGVSVNFQIKSLL